MELLTKADVCQRLKIAPRTVEAMVREGRFPPGVQMGKSVYWADEAVEKWRQHEFKKQMEWKPR